MTVVTDTRRLMAFVAVAEALHFGRAAARLGISQPTLSEKVTLLEKQLGIDLFVRDTRNVRLTEAGRSMLPAAVELLAHGERFASRADQVRRGLGGLSIRLGCLEGSVERVAPYVVSALRILAPDVPLISEPSQVDAALVQLRASMLDAMLTFEPGVPEYGGLDWVEIVGDDIVVAMAESHHLTVNSTLTVAQACEEGLAMWPAYRGTVEAAFEGLFTRRQVRPQIIRHQSYASTLLHIVSGQAITIGPRFALASAVPRGLVIRPLVNCDVTVAWGLLVDSAVQARMKAMLTAAAQAARRSMLATLT